MKRFFATAAVALTMSFGLVACETLDAVNKIDQAVQSASVDAKTVIIAANVFNALETTAKNYMKFERCDGTNGPVCRDPRATKIIIKAVRAGRPIRDNLEDFVRVHPDKLGPKGKYDALVAVIKTLKGVYAQYNIKG